MTVFTDLWFWFCWTVSLLSAVHVLLYKRDPRAQLGWLVVCLSLPGIGALIYWLLGVNRVRARAKTWQDERETTLDQARQLEDRYAVPADATDLPGGFDGLYRLANAVTRRPLLRGNRLQILHNGEAAYPAMLAAIDQAQHQIELATYIFENNAAGHRFAEALTRAAERGVEVRVLVDALGEKYSLPTIASRLKHPGITYAQFLPFSLDGRGLYFNLRNHGKILVVDHQIGFTGGMNIGDRHCVTLEPTAKKVVDIQFQVQGPVVTHLRQAFAENWYFTTGEKLPERSPLPEPVGEALCRGISAGPDRGFEKLHWIITGALHSARNKVQIMTPYFIPDRTLINALNSAVLRGVEVEIILPQRSNLPFVDWASRTYFWELLQHGVQIFYQPPPFCHSKLFLVDDTLALIGSANLDPRSLRLNFEFNLGVYDAAFSRALSAHFETVRATAETITIESVNHRSLGVKLRDGIFKLFSPYL